MSETKKPAEKAADKVPEPHHIRARVFALEFLLGQRVVLGELTTEALKLERYILGQKTNATPDQVEARITAIKCAARGQIVRGALIDAARPFEKYILTGEATAKARVPAAAGEAPADDPGVTGQSGSGAAGEADDIRPKGGRPSSRPELGREVEV